LPNTQHNQLQYQIALTMLPNIGSVLAKNLIAYCGSAEAVFRSSKAKLIKIPSIGEERVDGILNADVLKHAEEEIKFIEDENIKPLYFTDDDYPQRLKNCVDSPILLFYKGNADLNVKKIIGIVGTRKATEYGKEMTKKIVGELAIHDVLVISGLAYGIDVAAHQSALEHNLKTVGVLGHGLNMIYPSQHKSISQRMLMQGGLLSEYKSFEEMSPHKFPERNRIVAGMCDALLVVESGITGGAVITANIANSYNRDVFALPGRVNDKMSAGCNFLIKSFKATMIDSCKDILENMHWAEGDKPNRSVRQQRQLALNLTEAEQELYKKMDGQGEMEIDKLAIETGMNAGSLAATLLEMEMNGLVVSLPGKRFKLV
jgi:DNA processing protein